MKDINSNQLDIEVMYYSTPILNRGLTDRIEVKEFKSTQCNTCSKKNDCTLQDTIVTFKFNSVNRRVATSEVLCYFPTDDHYYRDNFYDDFDEEKTSGIFRCKFYEKTNIDYTSGQYLFGF